MTKSYDSGRDLKHCKLLILQIISDPAIKLCVKLFTELFDGFPHNAIKHCFAICDLNHFKKRGGNSHCTINQKGKKPSSDLKER